MGIFDSIGGWFEGAANTVADGVKTGVDTVSEGMVGGASVVADWTTTALQDISDWTLDEGRQIPGWTSGAIVSAGEGLRDAAFVVVDESLVLGRKAADGATSWMALIPVTLAGTGVKPAPTGGPRPIAIGERVTDPATGRVFIVMDGGLRHIPNPPTYDNLFRTWSGISPIGSASAYPAGPPLSDGAYLAKGTPDGKVFLIVDGQKRWIISPTVFDRFSFKWEAIRDVPASELEALPDGPTVTGEYIPDGRRVRDPGSGAVYVMMGSQLRHIPDPPTYDRLFRDWSNIAELTGPQAIGPQITQGAFLAKGTPDGRVFLMTDSQKKWITGPSVFDRFAFDWNKIVDVPANELAAVPEGAAIS